MIKKAKWTVKEANLRLKYMVTKDCIFCKMVKGEVSVAPVFESELSLAIADINPVAETHILVIPKTHIDSVLTLKDVDKKSLMDIFKSAQEIVEKLNLKGFRLAFNGGANQHVPHLHMHLLSGEKIEWKKL